MPIIKLISTMMAIAVLLAVGYALNEMEARNDIRNTK